MALRSLPQVRVPEPAHAQMVEIQLGHMCNNRCVFCSSGHLTQQGQALPMELPPVLAALDRAKARGARKITFLGGEPTLQRAFMPALEYATKLGFDEIEIFTNGVKASRPGFVDEVAAIGRFSWRFSIQGGDRAAHDETTKKPGAFDRIAAAMVNARSHGHRITANACINELNYRSLPGYPDLVRRYALEQLHVDMVRPVSVGERPPGYLEGIIPRHSAVAPYLREMLAAFQARDPDFDVNVGNFPPCVLPEWAHRVHHGGQATITEASLADNSLYSKDKYAFQAEDKQFGPRCDQCLLRSACGGVFSDYVEIHGHDELVPISLAGLAHAHDGRQHRLAKAVAPWIDLLTRSPAPRPWTAKAPQLQPDEGRIVLAFDFESTPHALRMDWLAPSERVQAPLLRTDDFMLTLSIDPRVDLRAVPPLARWVEECLAERPSASFSEAAFVAACIEPERLQRARAAIGRMVTRLRGSPEPDFGDWRFMGSSPDPHWPGARVEFDGSGDRVVCSLRAHHRRVGPTVMVEADASGTAAPERAQSCIQALKRSLRVG